MGDKRPSCDVCRTINLAKNVKHSKPDMQMYDKCTPMKPVDCGGNIPEAPVRATCIKVCTKEEYNRRLKPPTCRRMPHYAHGKLMYVVKAGILVGTVCFTYNEGVWGDQRQVNECIKRWSAYMTSINTRRPPKFDQCGNVIKKDTVENPIAPLYDVYKSCITTCFAGVVKVPLLVKCAYLDYLKALQKKYDEEVRERAIRKKS